jgi:hypothetical protein
MRPRVNQPVVTPFGQGVAQSPIILTGGVAKYLVRLPVNEQTTPHLHDVNCITPRAESSGLWCFSEDELSAVGASTLRVMEVSNVAAD